MTTAARIMGTIRANFYMTVWASIYFMLAAILGPATGLLEPMAFPQTIRGWAGIIGTGITFTLGYLFFFLGASIIGVPRAAMISIMEIVFIILFAILLVGEWLSAVQWLGVLIIIGSLIVMELSHQKE